MYKLKKEKISLSENLNSDSNSLKKRISIELNHEINIINFIERYFKLNNEIIFVSSTSSFSYINNSENNSISNLINLQKLNDYGYINKHLETHY